MAIIAFDDVQETSNTGGLGDLVFAGAAAGYRAFSSVCADKDQFSYTVRDAAGGAAFESGIGQYNTGANSLTRLEVSASSNAGAKVNFAATSKVVYMTVLARQIQPQGAFPWTPATGLLARWNAQLSQIDLHTRLYVKKWYDISGNGKHSDTNTTNPPKYNPRAFGPGLPGVFFNFNMKLMFSGIAQRPSPLKATIIIVGSNFEASGNSHVYNWAGNPIGFGATTPLDFMYNGTLPAAHPDVQAILQENRPAQYPSTYPVVVIHSYDGAASINSVMGSDQAVSPGTGASGVTNFFTIGSDSSTGVGGATAQTCKELLWEMALFDFPMTAADRILAYRYYRSMIPGLMTLV